MPPPPSPGVWNTDQKRSPPDGGDIGCGIRQRLPPPFFPFSRAYSNFTKRIVPTLKTQETLRRRFTVPFVLLSSMQFK